jgi:transcription elongation factor GreA
MTDNSFTIKQEIISLIKSHDYEKLESEWLKYLEAGDYDSDFIGQCTHLLASNNKTSILSNLLEMLIQEYSTKGIDDGVLYLGELLIEKKLFKTEFKDLLIKSIKSKFKNNSLLDKYLLYSELETSTDFEKAFRKINEFFYYDIGEVFLHTNWKVGVVINHDFIKHQIIVDFGKEGKKSFSFSGAREFLKKLDQSHYLSLLKKEPEKLKEMIRSNPQEFLKTILKQHENKISLTELKRIMLEGLIAESDWAKWWANTRIAIKKDAFLEFDESVKSEIRLRTRPKNDQPQYIDKFERAANPQEMMAIILDYAEMQSASYTEDDTPRAMADCIINRIKSTDDMNIVLKLQYCFTWEYLKKSVKGEYPEFPVTISEILSKAPNPVDVIFSFSNPDYQKKIMDAWLKEDPQGWLNYTDILLMKVSPKLLESLVKSLQGADAKEFLKEAIKKIISLKYHNPELYVWVLTQIVKGKFKLKNYNQYDMVIDIVAWMENLTKDIVPVPLNKKAKSSALSKARKLIEDGDFWLLRNSVIDIPLDDVRHLLDTFHSAVSLNDNFKSSVEYALTNARPDLFKQEEKSGETVDTTANHYCTMAMFEKKKNEYQKIMTVDIPENSKDIATARAHGDLRENAEYQSAKQKQKVLMKQADELRDLLERARPIDPTQISNERIAFGTKVHVLNQTNGKEEIYTILGIWEAQPENNIISYLSPLGRSLLAKKAGEIVDVLLPEGKVSYLVKSIEKVI